MRDRGRFVMLHVIWRVCILLLIVIHSALSATAGPIWPNLGFNWLHNGRSPLIGPSSGGICWSIDLGDGVSSSPVIGDTAVYVTAGGKLNAVSFTGDLLWTYPIGSTGLSSPAVGTDGSIYVASSDPYFYAISSSGTLKWKRLLGSGTSASPTIGPDGIIYIGCDSGKFCAYYPSGSLKFTYTAKSAISSSAAVGLDGSIYFGCDDGCLYALNSNGALKWKFVTNPVSQIKSSPSIGLDGSIYFGTMAGYFYAVTSSGTQKWRYIAGGQISSTAAVGADGCVYFGSRDRRLHCVSSIGMGRWTYSAGHYVDSSPAIDANGDIIFGCADGFVYSLDSSGGLNWSADLGYGILSSPSIGESNTLYIVTYDGRLACIGSDSTPPPAPMVTDDGHYTTSLTTLHASWQCDDPESGIEFYEYAIGTGPELDDIVPFTGIGTATEVTRDDLSLANGVRYFISVRATNGAGLVSLVGSSDGIVVDNTSPVLPVVIDDGDYTASSDQLHVIYSSGDVESGIAEYHVSVGTALGVTDVSGWSSSGTSKERTITGLALTHGSIYYINVRARNHAGLESTSSSNGILVDLTSPSVSQINASLTEKNMRVSVSAEDSESGIGQVEYMLLSSPELPEIPEWLASTSGTSFTIEGPFDLSQNYYLAIRVSNGAGTWSAPLISERISVDTTPPSIPVVTDSGAYSSNTSSLSASWSATDPETGIDHYSFCVGHAPGLSDVAPWTDTTNTSVTLTDLSLTNGGTYYFSVRATNGAGFVSEDGYSDGITVDTTSPTQPVVTDDGEYTGIGDSIHAMWQATDAESGIVEYLYCVGTAPGTGNIVGWTSAGMSTSVTVDVDLQVGVIYFFAVKARNGAGAWSTIGISDGIELGAAEPAWRKFRFDAGNTGASNLTGPITNRLHWRVQTNGYIESSAAVGGDGTLYVGSSDGKLYAISAGGSVRWTCQTGACIDSSPAIGADGCIYVGSYDGKLYAISPSGSVKWTYNANSMIWSSPGLDDTGRIYFGSQGGYFYCLNQNGGLAWKYRCGGSVWSSPAIAQDGSIYFGGGDGKLYALNSDGTLKWSYQTGSAIDSSPAIGPMGRVYFGSGDGYVYALNSNGSLHWKRWVGQVADSSPAIRQDGAIYFGTGGVGTSGAIYVYSQQGTELWTLDMPGGVRSSVALASDGVGYVGAADGRVYCMGPDGSVLWSYNTGQSILASPSITKSGAVVVGSDDGGFYCFKDFTGSDSTPPSTPKVALVRPFMAADEPVVAWWKAIDEESGVKSYSYAIGTQPEGNDILDWTEFTSMTAINRSDLQLEAGKIYYISVLARNHVELVSQVGVSQPITVTADDYESRIGAAKKRPDGALLQLNGKIVTAVMADGSFFIGELDRSSGVRCSPSANCDAVSVGDIVNAYGRMQTVNDERVFSDVTIKKVSEGIVKPLGICPHTVTRPGIDLRGQLVRLVGKVARVEDGNIILSSGENCEILVINVQASPSIGSQMMVTGVLCTQQISNEQVTVLYSCLEPQVFTPVQQKGSAATK